MSKYVSSGGSQTVGNEWNGTGMPLRDGALGSQ